LTIADAPVQREQRRYSADVAEGLRIIRASRFLSTFAAVQGLAALSAGATSALLVVLAERRYSAGAGRFGLLLGAIGVGAALGPLMLQRVVHEVRRPALLFGRYLLHGMVDLTLATASAFGVALGALALYGVGTSTGSVTASTALQSAVPDRVRGRVFAFYDAVWQSARLASTSVVFLPTRLASARSTTWAGGLLFLAGGVGLMRLRAGDLTPVR
jgi:hypothetical protein